MAIATFPHDGAEANRPAGSIHDRYSVRLVLIVSGLAVTNSVAQWVTMHSTTKLRQHRFLAYAQRQAC